jgi:hypothetical protein
MTPHPYHNPLAVIAAVWRWLVSPITHDKE